jgi:hypothetical protein
MSVPSITTYINVVNKNNIVLIVFLCILGLSFPFFLVVDILLNV